MNGQQPRDPELTYTDPKAYILWLRTRGLNPGQIDNLVRQRFGAGQTPQERAKQQASDAEKAGWAQVGGQLAGLAGGAYLGNQIFSGGAAAGATEGAVAVPSLLGGAEALGSTGATGGAASGAATGAGATTGAGMSTAAMGGIAALGAIGLNQLWEGGMKDIVRGRGTRADYINTGLMVGTGGLGGLPNLGLRLMGKRSIGAMMTSGKSDAQRLRDSFRSDLREAGVANKIDGSDHVTLADGSKFNIGLDGKTKYKNTDEKTTRNAWDVDFSNPLAKYATDRLDPMIRNIYGADDPKRKFFPGQYTGMLVNAVTSNAKNEQDVLANINAVLGKSKFAQQAGVGVNPPPPPRPGKGEVVRVSPGMYMNDKGHIQPAKTVRQALQMNYNKTKDKK